MMRYSFLGLLFFFSLSLNLANLSAQSVEAQTTLQKELSKVLDHRFADDEPGGSFLIKKGDKTLFQKNYGLADLITKEKITEHTIFNTGSISKTFVANGILILAEQGKLNLDDPITKYFDDFAHPNIAQKITIKHLLSHSSGLPDLRPVRSQQKFYLTAKDAENFAPLKATKKLNFQPGERFQYSNPAYNGLALIIEKVAEQPWQDFIAEHIFKAAGMEESTITNGPHPQTGVSHAYVKQGRYFVESDYGEVPTFAAAGNGGVWCSVLDLAKYETAIQSHRFLSADMVKTSRTAWDTGTWKGDTSPFLGYGWWVNGSLLDGLDVEAIYHTGSQGGFRAFHIYLPEEDILFVGLFNRPVNDFSQMIVESVKVLKNSAFTKN